MVVVSLLLGMTALPVTFAAGAALETPGMPSFREVSAVCVAAVLYLAFCQFWVAPRGSSGFWAKSPTLVASITPLLLMVAFAKEVSLVIGLLWLASGCLGSAIGALIAQRVTATPQAGTPTSDSSNRANTCRRNLLAGFILLAAIALLISIGVIPSVLADTAPNFNARPCGQFLGITVVFDLLAAVLLGGAVWRPRQRDPSSKGTLGITAFLALLMGLAYCGMGVLVSGHGPAMRIASGLLLLCAVMGLITTALMIVTSVIADRDRLSNLHTINGLPAPVS
jgi:hypothetical protein